MATRPTTEPEPGVRVDCDEQPPTLRVTVHGELDLATVGRLTCPDGTDSGISEVVLDLADLTFCDLVGLRTLVDFRLDQVRHNRAVSITRVQPRVRRVMEVVGVADDLLV